MADGVYGDRNRALIPAAVYARVETLRQAVIAGLIQVPRVPESATQAP
jgi:basic membrane lipoprotein Med (substrate-binding protein (PBP1-ABC) superfamily)